MDVRQSAAAVVFAAIFVLLALGRIGRLPLQRGVVALGGGLLTALLLHVSWRAIDAQVLLLLGGLMALAGLADAAGLFTGLRRWIGQLRPALALWTACFVVAIASALLLNDAAVVVLLPLLLPVLVARGLPAVPAATLLAVSANIGSLLTPYGNPQDAVLATEAGLGVADFLRVQGPLVLLGMALLAWPVWRLARGAEPVPAPSSQPQHSRGRPWLASCVAAFALAAALRPTWGLGTLAAAAALVAYAGVRPVAGRAADQAIKRCVDLNVLALFVGLYLLTGGLPKWFPDAWVPTKALLQPAPALAAVATLSNAVGNVPAVLVLVRLDRAWTVLHAPFLVATSTLGGALFLTGSAASLIAADQARRLGVEVRFLAFLRHAVWLLPLVLLAAWWTWAIH